ncbi:BZ3501_MvSof-1269-A2-R1_Chr10-1g02147 [Microbotryum saponariae]|nr:BZ3501_MvSof-1269-A2-R1_Chr10-1g02147 [Microbotryum saponariae]
MYQHTVVSAAPACGVHVPIRSHIQALGRLLYFSRRSTEATALPSQPPPPARYDNNPTDLGITTHIRARRAAVQNGQRGQRLSAMADPRLNATVS